MGNSCWGTNRSSSRRNNHISQGNSRNRNSKNKSNNDVYTKPTMPMHQPSDYRNYRRQQELNDDYRSYQKPPTSSHTRSYSNRTSPRANNRNFPTNYPLNQQSVTIQKERYSPRESNIPIQIRNHNDSNRMIRSTTDKSVYNRNDTTSYGIYDNSSKNYDYYKNPQSTFQSNRSSYHPYDNFDSTSKNRNNPRYSASKSPQLYGNTIDPQPQTYYKTDSTSRNRNNLRHIESPQRFDNTTNPSPRGYIHKSPTDRNTLSNNSLQQAIEISGTTYAHNIPHSSTRMQSNTPRNDLYPKNVNSSQIERNYEYPLTTYNNPSNELSRNSSQQKELIPNTNFIGISSSSNPLQFNDLDTELYSKTIKRFQNEKQNSSTIHDISNSQPQYKKYKFDEPNYWDSKSEDHKRYPKYIDKTDFGSKNKDILKADKNPIGQYPFNEQKYLDTRSKSHTTNSENMHKIDVKSKEKDKRKVDEHTVKPYPSVTPDIRCLIKEFNVVIIGQSGVGKSTLLNAMYNYLRFDTCYDALQGKLEHIIPTQFEVHDFETYEPITINTGYDKNENFNDVGSRTQTCKLHSMTYDNIKINFIDTPGLNDTRGLEQDEQNLQIIRDMLYRFDKIHAICIVLKPNESVLTIPFKTSLEMLLSIFPNNVTQNIVFFMTYAHGTFFQPGDTVRPLKGLSEYLSDLRGMRLPELRNDTFFCVDNEAFRYLCWIHQDRSVLNQELFKDFQYSWIESKKSVLRFIERLKTIVPFDTDSLKNIPANLLRQSGNNENFWF